MDSESKYNGKLLNKGEPVVSEHRLYKIIESSKSKLYSKSQYNSRKIKILEKEFCFLVLKPLLYASDLLINQRYNALLKRIKLYISEYPKIDTSALICEVFFDSYFRKGKKGYTSRSVLYEIVSKVVSKKQPIQIVIPLFPNKVACPLKNIGSDFDLGEIILLLRLRELIKLIKLFYSPGAEIVILSDGKRFSKAWNTPLNKIKKYQIQISIWIKRLSLENSITLIDYEDTLYTTLPIVFRNKRTYEYENSIRLYNKKIKPLLNIESMKESLLKTIDLDPDKDDLDQEGRFVPLFKSTLFSIDYSDRIKELTTINLFEKRRIYYQILRDILLDDKKHNLYQKLILERAWLGTIEYIAKVRQDRLIGIDPIAYIYPDCIRGTIHPKPGQVGIITISRGSYTTQPWHGIGCLKLSRGKVKADVKSVLELESLGYLPVHIEDSNRPIFYIDKTINLNKMSIIRSR